MNAYVVGYLTQDGLANGAIYALLALALVLVFAVTRVILIAQGEFVSFAAITFGLLQEGKAPGTLALLVGLTAIAALIEIGRAVARGEPLAGLRSGLALAVVPLALCALAWATRGYAVPALADAVLTVAIVGAVGPILYRIVYQPIAGASVLVLLIVSVAVHLVLLGLGLYFFGPNGSKSPPLLDISLDLGGVPVQAQTVVIFVATAVLMTALYVASEHTLYGKALRAAAINPVGARLMGISAAMAGQTAFLVAAVIGAVCGVLVSAVTTVYYDTGFLLGLKGFVAAIIGALGSFPLAAAGALGLGVLESFASFFASAFKEVIVFALIIPVLLWRSLTTVHAEDEE